MDINYIDIIFALIGAAYIWRGFSQGFLHLVARFCALIASIVLAYFAYRPVGAWIEAQFDLFSVFANGVGFIVSLIAIQIILMLALNLILSLIPGFIHRSIINRVLGIIPAALDAAIMIALVVFIFTFLPLFPSVREAVLSSKTGIYVQSAIPHIDSFARTILGGSIGDIMTSFTVKPESDSFIKLPFRPRSLEVEENAERDMLALLNEERRAVGAGQLVIDQTLVEIARAHSRDMWERQYFSHTNPDGEDPFDRMREGGATFVLAGENLALSPTAGMAHRGLMNSPGHKRNMLDPRFGRIGIGVIDGGIYGKMYTQVFAD